MKFFSTVTLLSLSVFVLATTAEIARPVSQEGLGDDIKNFFDKHVTFAFIEEVTPVIAKQVHKTFQRVARDNLGSSFSQAVDAQFNKFTSTKWPLEQWAFVNSSIIAPMKARVAQFHDQWSVQAESFYENLSQGAEAISVKGIKLGCDAYFAVGDAHREMPIAINLTHTGLEGWVQKKLEGIHANVVYETAPLMKNYVFSLKGQVLDFISLTVREALEKVVGETVANSFIGRNMLDGFASGVKSFAALGSDLGLEKAAAEASLMNKKVLREELYRPFKFLSGDVAKINGQLQA